MPTDQTFHSRAIAEGHAELTGEGKQQKIHYIAADHTERYTDPEEQVRAEFWAELIHHYGYEPERDLQVASTGEGVRHKKFRERVSI